MPVKGDIVLPKGAKLVQDEPKETIVLPKGAKLVQDTPIKKKDFQNLLQSLRKLVQKILYNLH